MSPESPTNEDLTAKRCFHHAMREAVARCPHCQRFFCRECVTEHEGRISCAQCLRKIGEQEEARRRRTVGVGGVLAAAMGIAVAWGTFHLIGWILLKLPAGFHKGTIWMK